MAELPLLTGAKTFACGDYALVDLAKRSHKWLTNGSAAQQVLGADLGQEFGVEAAGLDCKVIQLPLLVALRQDVLLDGGFRDQAVDVHWPRLPDAVAPILCLGDTTRKFLYSESLNSAQMAAAWFTRQNACTGRVWRMRQRRSCAWSEGLQSHSGSPSLTPHRLSSSMLTSDGHHRQQLCAGCIRPMWWQRRSARSGAADPTAIPRSVYK